MSWTKRQIVEQALEELGLASYEPYRVCRRLFYLS